MTYKVINTSLKSLINDDSITNIIEDVANRVNLLTIEVYDFYRLYILYCYDNDIEFPIIDKPLFIKIFSLVSEKKKAGRPVRTNLDLLEKLKSFL